MAVLFLFPMVKRAVNRTPLWSTVKPRTETSLRLLLQKLCRLRRRWCLRLQYCLSSYCGSLSRPALRPRSVNPARSLFIYSRAVLLQCFTLFGAWAKVVSSLSTSCRRPVQTFFTTLALTTFVVSAPLAMSVLRARLLRAQLSPDPVSAPGGPASVRTLIHPTGVPYAGPAQARELCTSRPRYTSVPDFFWVSSCRGVVLSGLKILLPDSSGWILSSCRGSDCTAPTWPLLQRVTTACLICVKPELSAAARRQFRSWRVRVLIRWVSTLVCRV